VTLAISIINISRKVLVKVVGPGVSNHVGVSAARCTE